MALNFFFFPLGAVAFGTFIALVAYSIVRYQFLDVNLARQKLLIFFLVYGSLLSILLPPISYQLHRAIQHHGMDVINSFLFIAILVGIVFSCGPLLYAFLTRRDFWLRTATTTGLAHELKSPIAAISGATDLLSKQLQSLQDSNSLKTYADIIQRNVERLQSYVGDLLNLAHADDCHLLLKLEPTNLKIIAQHVIDHYQTAVDQKGLTIKLKAEGIFIANIDPLRIEQVISNLVSNAIRYSDEGEIVVSIEKQENSILISVSDQGRGIPQQDLERVFERFYQVDKTGQGSGIGLTIAKTWVEAHGGRIWVKQRSENIGFGDYFYIARLLIR